MLGTTRLYSSLNRDAARSARMGQWRRAQDLARHAESIEQADATRALLGSLAFRTTARPRDAVDILVQALPEAADPTETARLLAELADRTEELRQRSETQAGRHRTLLVARVRSCTSLPVAVGLGVRDGAQAAEVASFADGVIVGSAFVQRLLDAPDPAAGIGAVRDLAGDLAGGVRHPARPR